MRIVNFSHTLTKQQKIEIEHMTGEIILDVVNVMVQISPFSFFF